MSIETRRKTIQHLQGGIIKDVVVREGQRVRKGDPLVMLEDATVRASYETIRQNYLAQRALESRLLAEALGKATIEFQPMQPGDVKETYADIEASRRDLGFEPRTPIDEGIPRFVDWFRKYHGV